MAMIKTVSANAQSWELHYCARAREFAASITPENVFECFSEEPLVNTAELLAEYRDGEHFYCCGPDPLMEAVKMSSLHWPQGHVHFEWFANPVTDYAPNRAF